GDRCPEREFGRECPDYQWAGCSYCPPEIEQEVLRCRAGCRRICFRQECSNTGHVVDRKPHDASHPKQLDRCGHPRIQKYGASCSNREDNENRSASYTISKLTKRQYANHHSEHCYGSP